MNKSINERENKAGSDSSPQEPRAAAWKTPSPVCITEFTFHVARC